MKQNQLLIAVLIASQVGTVAISLPADAGTVDPSHVTNGGRAADLVNSIGVNAHGSKAINRYSSAQNIIKALDYIGVNNVRDALPEETGKGRDIVKSMAQAGVRFNFRVTSDLPQRGSAGMSRYLSSLKSFVKAYPGSVGSVEGINEANTTKFSYNGDTSVKGAARFQCALYNAIRSDSYLKDITIVNLSLATRDPAIFGALGNLDSCAQASNSHIYTAAGSTSDKQFKESMALARKVVPGDPIYVTEMGHHTLKTVPSVGVGVVAQAKLTLSEILVARQNGARMAFLYELFDNDTNKDPNETDSQKKEAYFGLFYGEGSPKPAATALRNFVQILKYADTGSADGNVSAKLSIESDLTSIHAVRFEKSASYVVAVWRDVPVWISSKSEDNPNEPGKTVVDLGHTARTVRVYDPVARLTPIYRYSNMRYINMPTLKDRPLLIEVNATRDVPAPN